MATQRSDPHRREALEDPRNDGNHEPWNIRKRVKRCSKNRTRRARSSPTQDQERVEKQAFSAPPGHDADQQAQPHARDLDIEYRTAENGWRRAEPSQQEVAAQNGGRQPNPQTRVQRTARP